MKKRLLGLLFMLCVFSFIAKAQEFSPFISSPYSGVTAGKLNPASLAGSKYKFDVTLFGASSGVHNDLLIFSRKKVIFNTKFYSDLLDYRTDFFDLNIPVAARNDIKGYLGYNSATLDKDLHGGYFGGQLDILNLMYSFNDRFALAAGYSKRWQASVNGMPKEIASEFFNRYISGLEAFSSVQQSGATTAAVAIYDQIFVSAAYTLLKQDNHLFKAGVTGKLLFNGASAFAFAENYQGTLMGSNRGLRPVSGQLGEAGISGDIKLGFGADVGVEYEYRPDALIGNEVAEYRIKAGVSVLDLGSFQSKNANYRALNSGSGIPTGIESLLNRYGAGPQKGEYTMGLPTVVAASLDYHIATTPFFVNFTPYIALGQNSTAKTYKFHSYNLIPHAEWKNFGVSVPLQYDQYGKFTAGIGLRAWQYVWIGSNTLLKNLWPLGDNKNYSADFHVMVKVPIMAGDNDRDKDGVPDKKDRCPDVPGLKKYQGCPDTDGDGIPDDQDACPNEAGPASTNGCPDRDGDGIPDKDDRCPDQAGTKELQGCPDRDGDGVADIDDECPDQAGPKATKGCPDRDGDGVADKDDRCPDQPGPVALKGCPDRDGDGVADLDDECPDEAGPASNKGCPLSPKIQNVEFDIDKYNIKAQYHAELDKVVDLLTKNPNASVTVVGHTDITYTHAYNMQLSKRRAEAVKNYLVQKNVDAKRITTEYYGPDRPIADNNTVDGRSRNRRSEITIVIK
ncbi:MAG: OmpA family protein [Prevotellaceae bacterium]|nr:OmpA family protein [Prevotellaceae bacterium]